MILFFLLLGSSHVKLTPDRSVCQLELDPGPCDASILRYGFHRQKGRCIEFVYGGCQGNANNFESKSECEAICGREDSGKSCYLKLFYDYL